MASIPAVSGAVYTLIPGRRPVDAGPADFSMNAQKPGAVNRKMAPGGVFGPTSPFADPLRSDIITKNTVDSRLRRCHIPVVTGT